MLDDPKYIVVQTRNGEMPRILSPADTHSDAVGLQTVVSAGFVRFRTKEGRMGCEVYGASESTGRRFRDIDAILIQQHILDPLGLGL